MDRMDIAIVGAGPAGSRAAWRLARAGARVTLFDGSHPREKPCGGGVTGRALELLGNAIDSPALAAALIQSATFERGPDRAQMRIEQPPDASPHLVVTSRARFDAALLAAAIDAGATFVPERITHVSRADGGWQVTTRHGAAHAAWVLGADGPNSLVRKRVSRPFDRADLSIATGFFVHGVTSRDISIGFEDNPAGYLWSFPRPDHLAVGVCAQADVSSPSMLASIASSWIARNVASGPAGPTLERYSWPIPSLRESTLRLEQPAGTGWLLLGDAGGMVDPITREGIFFALSSADAAAECLVEDRDPAVAYVARIRRSIYDELVRAARLKASFFRPRFTGLLIRALEKSPGIRSVMLDLIAGRQPYRGLRRRLLATMELGLMVKMLRQ